MSCIAISAQRPPTGLYDFVHTVGGTRVVHTVGGWVVNKTLFGSYFALGFEEFVGVEQSCSSKERF